MTLVDRPLQDGVQTRALFCFDGPFGGHKASGIGREFDAIGLTGYVEHKTITRNR